MKNSVSNNSLYIESEDEDEEKLSDREEVYNGGNDSDSSDDYSIGSQQQIKPSSYNTAWPQSYRQSMDMYSSVASPNIGFLGTPTLSRLSSSFLSSSLTRRHTPEVLSKLVKPLLPTVADHEPPQQQQQQEHQKRRSSHSLHPPVSRRSSSLKTIDQIKTSRVSHEVSLPRQCSYGQAVLNGINVLCGVGILSTPYAVREGGWYSLSILFIFGVLSWYTGILLRYCLDSEPGLETYPDIGQAAFGRVGRIAISIILYVELYACCVEYIILEGDNLSSLFPNAYLSIGGFVLKSHHLFALMSTLAVLPTVWLRDLSILSYISAGGVVASILVVLCLFWAGLVDQVGVPSKHSSLNLTTLPVAIGLYGYCYSGHAVFPNVYTSMAKPNQYPSVLLTSFIIVTMMYGGVAVMGYTMFGETTLSQYTLNMPQDLVVSKIAVWTTVVNPFTKYALTMNPVALCLEELIPSQYMKSPMYSILIRTSLVISTLLVGLAIPFFDGSMPYTVVPTFYNKQELDHWKGFQSTPHDQNTLARSHNGSWMGLVMALIGSLLTMLVTLILPCACFLSILRGKITWIQGSLCILIILVGLTSSVFGTFSALSKIIQNLS